MAFHVGSFLQLLNTHEGINVPSFKQKRIMEKLISMTEFVLIHKGKTEFYMSDTIIETGKLMQKIFKYAGFLKQPLTLGMFVPCDANGNVLKEPILQHGWDVNGEPTIYTQTYKDDLKKWNEAKEKVLFEGCDVKEIKSEKNYFVVYHKSQQIWISWTYRIIEDMIPNRTYLNGLELTPSALKQIGL